MISFSASAKKTIPVFITAGQSNTDGRIGNELLPDYIQQNKYKHCYWCYNSGAHSMNGQFELFWPRIINKNKPGRWTYDAVTYYWLEQSLKEDFYVIKESLGGTAIDLSCGSNQKMYWCASPAYLDSVAASDRGGKSLLKAVIAYVRQHLVEKTGDKRYAQLPIILGGISHKSRGWSQGVEDAQKRLQAEDKNIHLVEVPNTEMQKDNIHFNAAGGEILGRKMYNKLVELKLAGKKAKTIETRK